MNTFVELLVTASISELLFSAFFLVMTSWSILSEESTVDNFVTYINAWPRMPKNSVLAINTAIVVMSFISWGAGIAVGYWLGHLAFMVACTTAVFNLVYLIILITKAKRKVTQVTIL